MSMFGGPTSREVDAFAKELAESVVRRYPPALDTAKNRVVSANRLTKILEDVFDKASEFGRSNRLGVYKRARLGNSFRWELRERGYTDKFVELATEGLIVYLTRKQPSKAPQ